MEYFEKAQLAKKTLGSTSAVAGDLFDKFCTANTFDSILVHFRHLCSVIESQPTHFPQFLARLKINLTSIENQAFLQKYEEKAKQGPYENGTVAKSLRVLVVGGGPCGLRTAIEAQLLGAKVIVVEKRRAFSRNNVLHLWPFVMADLKGLGAKTFYRKFCAGAIDHISISCLECILLKVALILGVEVCEGLEFLGVKEPEEGAGWRPIVSREDHPLGKFTVDAVIGGSGKGVVLAGFVRKELRAKLAIAITANFANRRSEAEARVEEISGVSFIFRQEKFNQLLEESGIELENLVYYKDETHYFVMTVKKQSLLWKGVLKENYVETAELLDRENVDSEALLSFILEAVNFWTEGKLPNREFALNHRGEPDVALFDFTAMYQAENACQVLERQNQTLLVGLVGDSLLEPFWPTGSGISRGFLSSLDACWMLRAWAKSSSHKCQSSMLQVLAERESIYRLLPQTTIDNLKKAHAQYNVDPATRYVSLNLSLVSVAQVKGLYRTEALGPFAEALDDAELTGSSSEDSDEYQGLEDSAKYCRELEPIAKGFSPAMSNDFDARFGKTDPYEENGAAEAEGGPPIWNCTAYVSTTIYAQDDNPQQEERSSSEALRMFSRLSRSVTLPSNTTCPFAGLRHKTSFRTSRVKGFVERLEDSRQNSINQEEFDSAQETSPYMQELNELRQKREEYAQNSKMEALARIRQLQERKQAMRHERKERAIRKLESAQLPKSMTTSCDGDPNFSSKQNDEFFDEYKMRLYRKSVPSIGQRSQLLEGKLSNLMGATNKVHLAAATGNEGTSLNSPEVQDKDIELNENEAPCFSLSPESSRVGSKIGKECEVATTAGPSNSKTGEEIKMAALMRVSEEEERVRREDELAARRKAREEAGKAEMAEAEMILDELPEEDLAQLLSWAEEEGDNS